MIWASIRKHWPAGINGAGKTTQLQIIAGALQPDSGSVIKERPNMKIAYLTQEFDVEPTRTVRVCTVRPCFPSSHAQCHCTRSVPTSKCCGPKQGSHMVPPLSGGMHFGLREARAAALRRHTGKMAHHKSQSIDSRPHAPQEEFMSAYGEQVQLLQRQEQIQKELEDCGEDMDRMSDLLDELQASVLIGLQLHSQNR